MKARQSKRAKLILQEEERSRQLLRRIYEQKKVMPETKEELINSWAGWLLKRLGENKRANETYIKEALLECAKDYNKTKEGESKL